jgi:hypothetical protein
MCFIIWILLIVLCKINSCLIQCYSFLEVLNQNLNLKFHHGFLVCIPWCSYEWKKKTCHDCHGFKWKNINIYSILIVFLCGSMPILARWIVIAPTWMFWKETLIWGPPCDVTIDINNVASNSIENLIPIIKLKNPKYIV